MTEAEDKLRSRLDEILEEGVDDFYKETHPVSLITGEIINAVKEAGYKPPEEVAELLARAREGYVKLAEDQALPPVVESAQDTEYNRGFTDGSKYEQSQLVADNWKKIKQE